MTRPWFRIYRKLCDAHKVHALSPVLFRAWVLALATTDDEGKLPPMPEIAFKLRTPLSKVRDQIQQLVELKFFDSTPNGLIAHDWSEHQYDSDVSTDRVKRFRQRFKKPDGNVSATPPDTDTDTDTEKRVEVRTASPRTSPTGTRWAADAVVSEEWIAKGIAARAAANLPAIDLKLQATLFQNFWSSKSGRDATKTNWERTWINWSLKADERTSTRSTHSGLAGGPASLAARVFRE